MTGLGAAAAVLWEVGEWAGHTFLDPRISVGYEDTIGDLVAGLAGQRRRGGRAGEAVVTAPTLPTISVVIPARDDAAALARPGLDRADHDIISTAPGAGHHDRWRIPRACGMGPLTRRRWLPRLNYLWRRLALGQAWACVEVVDGSPLIVLVSAIPARSIRHNNPPRSATTSTSPSRSDPARGSTSTQPCLGVSGPARCAAARGACGDSTEHD